METQRDRLILVQKKYELRLNLVVFGKDHGENGPPLCRGPQIGGIPEHGLQGNLRLNFADRSFGINGLNFTLPGINVADHISHELAGRYHIDHYNRFKHDGLRLTAAVAKCG